MKDSGDDRSMFIPVPSTTDNVIENGPTDLHKDCDADTLSPEFTNTWGDFEAFTEFTQQSEHFYEDGSPEENGLVTSTADGEARADQTDGEALWNAFNLGNENRRECERIFRLSFPAVPVEDESEDVGSLTDLLLSPEEENISQLLKTRLWLEGDLSWQRGDCMSSKSGCEWRNSKGCTDLVRMLESTAENSSNDGGKTDNALKDMDQSHVNESTTPAGNKYLIQTKLDVAPGSKTGHILSYQLVPKKSPSDRLFSLFQGKSIFSV